MATTRSVHDTKFDRQMRLWGGHGQQALEQAHICILGSSATATETLKNLVLPNVGAFTIIDDALVCEADLGNNFFVDESSLGRSRAEVVTQWMKEMNSDVTGHHIHAGIGATVNNNISILKQFNCVFACQLPEALIRTLAAYLYPLNIPLILVKTYGLIGYARLQIKEHTIIESHPGGDISDLYIHPSQLALWPELHRYVNSFLLLPKPATVREVYDDTRAVSIEDDQPAATVDATHPPQHIQASSTHDQPSLYLNGTGLDSEEHAHIPYIAILAQLMQLWLVSHTKPPQTYEQKKAFKQSVIDLSWDYANETNFAEAVDAAHRCYELPTLSPQTQAVYHDPAVSALSASSRAFWILTAAVKRFVAKEGGGVCMPVSMDIPDMHSKTDWYIKLKEIFKRKSEADVLAVQQHLQQILHELQADKGLLEKPGSGLTAADVAYFVKHCRTLRIVRTRSIPEEYDNSDSHVTNTINSMFEEAAYEAMDAESTADADEDAAAAFKPPNPLVIHWYLALRTVEKYYQKHGHYPGLLTQAEIDSVEKPNSRAAVHAEPTEELNHPSTAGDWQKDAEEVVTLLQQLFVSLSLTAPADASTAVELTRFGACEPHVIAAYMGGQAAQIGLKVLLKQYVPINNTVLFNGIHCSSKTWNL